MKAVGSKHITNHRHRNTLTVGALVVLGIVLKIVEPLHSVNFGN